MRKSIIVRTSFEGYHRWPEAPTEVAFLRSVHRHVFEVALEIEVKHNDRELEFFMVQKRLKMLVDDFRTAKSCEQMADEIIQWATKTYGKDRYYRCEVSEDGENSGVIET